MTGVNIYRNLSGELFKGSVATIGIFDGVHLAHQQIIARLNELAAIQKTKSLLVTLWPHPRYVLNKDAEMLRLITTLDEKLHQIEKAGIEHVVIIPFDQQFASIPFDKFIEKILVEKLAVRNLVVGFNHQFGRDREGNYDKLKLHATKFGFGLEQLPKIEVDGQRVSSSAIRNAISGGNIALANNMLGYTYSFKGKVVHGNKIGNQLGFPTANIEVAEIYKLLPSDGVYAVEGLIGDSDQRIQGMMNIGTRPTVHTNGNKVIEVNFFNFAQSIYDEQLTLFVHERIREEKVFLSIQKLIEQIQKDKKEIINYFKTK